jgi:Na+/H+ antiporter NhaD/arsenite permease-like protein
MQAKILRALQERVVTPVGGKPVYVNARATILWLVALRRERQDVSAWGFLRLGLVVTPPALLLSIVTAVWVIGHRW